MSLFQVHTRYGVYMHLIFCDMFSFGGVYCLSSCLAALQVALVVAQRRESGDRLSGIKLSALSIGLQRVAMMARKKKGKKIPFSIYSILECLSYGTNIIPSLLDCAHS